MLYNFIGLNVIPWDVQLIWRDVIGSTGNDVYASPLHVFFGPEFFAVDVPALFCGSVFLDE